MDDLSKNIADILNDPQSVERIKSMAAGLFGENKQEEEPPRPSFPDISELGGIMNVLSKLKTGGEDDRTRLLLALKPHLSEEKRKKVDTAIKLLRIVELLPMLKESGLLEKLI